MFFKIPKFLTKLCKNHGKRCSFSVHCKKYNSTSPNLGKQLPFFGTEILHKTSLNQSYNNLRAAFLNLVWKRFIFNTFGKVLPRIGTCKASSKDWHKYADLLWKALLSTCSELPSIGTNLLEFLQFTYELWLFQTLVLQYISWVKMIRICNSTWIRPLRFGRFCF